MMTQKMMSPKNDVPKTRHQQKPRAATFFVDVTTTNNKLKHIHTNGVHTNEGEPKHHIKQVRFSEIPKRIIDRPKTILHKPKITIKNILQKIARVEIFFEVL